MAVSKKLRNKRRADVTASKSAKSRHRGRFASQQTVISSKEYVKSIYPLRHNWTFYGLMETLKVDNGKFSG